MAPLDKLSVSLVMLYAFLLPGEKLTMAEIAGGVLIVVGAIFMIVGHAKLRLAGRLAAGDLFVVIHAVPQPLEHVRRHQP